MVQYELDINDGQNESTVNLDEFTFTVIEAVKGSGYEEKVSTLALHDGVAHRAARPNMQKFPALIVERKEDGAFVGFVTFNATIKSRSFVSCSRQSGMNGLATSCICTWLRLRWRRTWTNTRHS